MFLMSLYAVAITVGLCLYWFLHSITAKKSSTYLEAAPSSESKDPPEDNGSFQISDVDSDSMFCVRLTKSRLCACGSLKKSFTHEDRLSSDNKLGRLGSLWKALELVCGNLGTLDTSKIEELVNKYLRKCATCLQRNWFMLFLEALSGPI